MLFPSDVAILVLALLVLAFFTTPIIAMLGALALVLVLVFLLVILLLVMRLGLFRRQFLVIRSP